ncbi:hypothetical protein RRF57_011203 [Xylaria bambusicola]|uniref:RING-type domain-containing protein n=1 Tax=Xylaria bambusicola TaxID=326684 RepID=A0AAN7UY74_9PEZI
MASFSYQRVYEAVRFVESEFRRVASPNGSTGPNLQCPPGLSPEEYEKSLLKGPPPGLVRVSAPVNTPTRVLTNEDVSLFGDFARYLGEGGNIDDEGFIVKLDLKCGICFDHPLWVADCASPDEHFHSTELFEGIVVIPCGHYYGSECLDEWLRTSNREGFANQEGAFSCPACRYSLKYRCGHYLAPIEYSPDTHRNQTVPLTIPEGGHVSHYCEDCAEQRVDRAIDELRGLLFQPIMPSDLRFHNSEEILQQTSREFGAYAKTYWQRMQKHYNMW